MSSSNKKFNSEINPEVSNLASRLLSAEEIILADKISEQLLGDEVDRHTAIKHLREFIGVMPKRPVYYLNYEVGGLPENTRDVVRYTGDYIDQLIKNYSYEKGNFHILRYRALKLSLGSNLKKLSKDIPKDILDSLTAFNEILYVPAKHVFDVGDRPHLFTARVYSCFLMKKFAKQIIPLSIEAKKYSENGKYEYHSDSTQDHYQ